MTLMTRTARTHGPPPAFVSTPATSRGRGTTIPCAAAEQRRRARPAPHRALCRLRLASGSVAVDKIRWGRGLRRLRVVVVGPRSGWSVGPAWRCAKERPPLRTFDPDDATWERPMVRRGQRPGTGTGRRDAMRPVFYSAVIKENQASFSLQNFGFFLLL